LGTEKGIRKGFIIAIIVIIIGITAYFYIDENRFIENSTTIIGKITDIKRIPRRQVLTIQAKDEVKRKITIASWDDRRIGEEIKIRVGDENHSQVEVDEFLYLHKVSMGFFAGCCILFCIVSGVVIFKKK
jgi:hypothetical protein